MVEILLPASAAVLVVLAISPAGRNRAVALALCGGLLLLAAFAAGYSRGNPSPARIVLAIVFLGAALTVAGTRLRKP